MNDQIKSIEQLLAANLATKQRTSFLDVAAGGLRTALENSKEHVAELGRQIEARRKKVVEDAEALKKLQEQVKQDGAATAEPEAATPATKSSK